MVDKNLLNNVLKMAKSQKEAYAPPLPPPGGDPSQMGMPPPGGMPPAGGMPMDPSQMGVMSPVPGGPVGMPPMPGGAPMDASQMGALPPVPGGMPPDPSQMASPDPNAAAGPVPIMLSTEDLMGLVQMAAQGGQGGDGGAGQASQEGGEETGAGETGRLTNKKLLKALEERISGIEDMLAQMMNAMGIQVQEQPLAAGGTPPGVVGGMGEGAPPPMDLGGGMPSPMPPPEMGPVSMGKMASGTPLSEALRKMRLINSYRE